MDIKYTQSQTNIKFGDSYFSNLLSGDASKFGKWFKRYELGINFSLAFIVAYLLSRFFDLHLVIVIILALAIVYLVSFLFYFIVIQKKSCEIDFNNTLDRYRNIRIELSESGLTIYIPNVTMQYNWEAMDHFKVFDDYIILAMDKYHGECIPIDSFASAKEKEDFIATLKQYNVNER